ncbi:hypothetical protein Shyd_93730 [Streptomyces hydrogenans]|uniref:Uncharacterized protein n=1 Tax=Streptomyces hydrogenans TaxID=1873719 RepID=A0ABQ3PSK5_9ACTN|nr:hypothetical protein [Streptomyces hydrogenans]GHI28002.1 hypothetical protein Shyd_93730 [Streptomyces hydrogenans]
MPELAMPKAAKRRGRTRTSRVSPLAPIVLSTLSPGHIDMRTVESTQTRRISLVCPACKTWVAVTPPAAPTCSSSSRTTPARPASTPRSAAAPATDSST